MASHALGGPTERAGDYLVAEQDPISGGFSSGDATDGSVKAAYTDWAALAIVAAGEDPRYVGGDATLRAAVTDAAIAATSTVALTRSIQAVVAVGANPRSLRGRNLVAELRTRQALDGTFDGHVLATAWALLALRSSAASVDEPGILAAAAALARLQRPDGGWGEEGGESDPAVTAAVVQALVSLGASPREIPLARARTWLAGQQTASGGIRPAGGGRADALTTAWVVLAVSALGDTPGAAPWNRGGGPRSYLLGLQRPDGSFAYRPGQRASPNWVSAVAAVAAARRFLPMRPTRQPREIDHRPAVVGRTPAAGSDFEGRLIVRMRDNRGGTGVDPRSIRLRLNGLDVTSRARVSAFAVEISGLRVSTQDPIRVELDLADRAGNGRRLAWSLGPMAP